MTNSPAGLCARVLQACSAADISGTFLVGIAGPPAAGKTTLSENLVRDLQDAGVTAQALQMDGFHMTNAELEERDLVKFKGREDTFNPDLLLAAIQNLKTAKAEFWWPIYSRELHNPVSQGVLLRPDLQIAVLEGNYLFLDQGAWAEAGKFIDYKIFLEAKDDDINDRLLRRHLAGGKSDAEARDKIETSDLVNVSHIREASNLSQIDEVIDANAI
ncbi:AAA family ATPase [Sulfitobacter donghicola]|uniref:Phosphoribulokinase/uridine kinase domain-containing protein n=1 Tax=Sulfitobacter donghicola DSW-25 = KCTC 12864 = JCM 14565 TaxID=1300350 RepID=A0A073IE49_9RHOB|nr:AAA family ATPase [Sulfitobacter donghicola]KEJ87845.1 hypothetical protein DSW25_04715 [Sulfitobacter donghicola DSW-25 = KCTC 12864 = JCM 14565]KIN60015.1 Kinase-related protein [Sulfitobacter donghicola DSW-25 = KCTC 12864 = JCM 14565]